MTGFFPLKSKQIKHWRERDYDGIEGTKSNQPRNGSDQRAMTQLHGMGESGYFDSMILMEPHNAETLVTGKRKEIIHRDGFQPLKNSSDSLKQNKYLNLLSSSDSLKQKL